MHILLFGATGLVGRAALIECLDDPAVTAVTAVVRRPTGTDHPKLRELIHKDFLDYAAIEADFDQCDACLYCLGISAAGMSEEDYRRITYEFAVAAGEAMLRANPQMRMCFVSGSGAGLESRQMWARVKAETEQALLAMPWSAASMFRPAGIFPRKGVKAGTRLYRTIYATLGWAYGAFKAMAPGTFTTTDQLGRALIAVARDGHELDILESPDVHAVCD